MNDIVGFYRLTGEGFSILGERNALSNLYGSLLIYMNKVHSDTALFFFNT